MTTELRIHSNQAQQSWVRALSGAWRAPRLHDPSLWLLREPEIEEQILRDADICGAVTQRLHMIAGNQWSLTPRDGKHERADLAVEVGTELVGAIKHFTQARLNLGRAFLSGSRFARIQPEPRKLALGDGRVRTWWVPVELPDVDKRMYQIVKDEGDTIAHHWERWDLLKQEFIPESRLDAIQTIRHVYADDQGSLGHGRALREAIGWWHYSKTHVHQESIQAVERFAQGMLRAKVAGARDAESGLPNTELITQWTNTLEDQRARHVLVHDADDDVDIISGNAEGHQLLKDMRSELKNTLLTLILGANLPTSADKGGSFALADVQQDSTQVIVRFDRECLEETLSDDLLGCIWFKNHANLHELGIADQKPRLSIAQDKIHDPEKRAAVANVLHGMGVPLSSSELYEQTGWSQPEEGEAIIEGAAAPVAPGPFGADAFGAGVPL